jgi:hypothetical protein
MARYRHYRVARTHPDRPEPRRLTTETCEAGRIERKGEKVADCREWPSESGCTLTISGEEDEVIVAATHHAMTVHGHEDVAEVHAWLHENLRDEAPVGS